MKPDTHNKNNQKCVVFILNTEDLSTGYTNLSSQQHFKNRSFVLTIKLTVQILTFSIIEEKVEHMDQDPDAFAKWRYRWPAI
jgi:hypothetical protein